MTFRSSFLLLLFIVRAQERKKLQQKEEEILQMQKLMAKLESCWAMSSMPHLTIIGLK